MLWLATKPVMKPSKQASLGSREPQGVREQRCTCASRAKCAIEPQLPRVSDQFAGHACSIGRGSSREHLWGRSSPNFFPPSRCLHCEEIGHVTKNYKRPRLPRPPRGRGRPTRRVGSSTDAAVASHRRGQGHSATSASTASSGSASTGRAYSGPPSICALSPAGRTSSSEDPGVSPVAASKFPWGHSSRHPSLVVRMVPHTMELQHDEDTLVATTLIVLVIGTHPSLTPF